MRGLLILLIVTRAVAAGADAGSGVTCVDAATGSARWRTPTAKGFTRLRGDGDTLWTARPGEAWERRDLATGRVLAAGAPPAAAEAVSDDLWTTTDAIFEAVEGEARAVVTTGAFVDDLAVIGDVLAFALDKDDGEVHGWDRAIGARAWTLRPRELLPEVEIGDGSRVEAIGDRLLVYAPPAVIAVDPADGTALWATAVPALQGRWGGLRATADGDRWIVSVDGVVVALDAATGVLRWTVDAGAGAASSLVVGASVACFDRRAEEALPFTRDEAEVARSLEVTVSGGAITSLRWVRRADARGTSIIELPLATAGVALTLTAGDAEIRRDVTALRAEDGVHVVDVPGAWEDARVGKIVAAEP